MTTYVDGEKTYLYDATTGLPIPATAFGGGGGGGGSLSAKANAATQTSTEGAITDPLSMDLSRNLRVVDAATLAQLVTMNTAIADTTTPSPVKIDQTTPGTTNGIVINASALPTGAAVETGGNLAATATSAASIVTNTGTIATNTAAGATRVVTGNVASAATDSGNPVKVGGIYHSANQTFTDGQRADLQLDVAGSLKCRITGPNTSGSDGFSNSLIMLYSNSAGASTLMPGSAGYVFNGTSWDRQRKTNVFKRIASSAASGNPDFLKASAGDLTGVWGLCGATAVYLQLYNKASAPTIGTDTPVLTYPINANERFDKSFQGGPGGAYFSTGIAFAFTTDAAGATGAAAAAVTACALTGA